jgi:phosphatidylserine decarboxylase
MMPWIKKNRLVDQSQELKGCGVETRRAPTIVTEALPRRLSRHGASMSYPHPLIAREGWPFIALRSIAAAIIVHGSSAGWWALPLWLIAVFVVQFFRDPPRAVPSGAQGRALAG